MRPQAAVMSQVTGASAVEHFRHIPRVARSIERWHVDDHEQEDARDDAVEEGVIDQRSRCVCCVQ